MSETTTGKRALSRVRKVIGSKDRVCQVFWVDHSNHTAGCVFEDYYQVRYCEGVPLDELEGDRRDGTRLTDAEVREWLEREAAVVIRDPNV